MLEFSSLLSYIPRPTSEEMQRAKNAMFAIKSDAFIEQPRHQPIPMSQWIATAVHREMSTLTFIPFFQPDTVLVPVPKSSLMQPDTLWVPDRIATALVKAGVGKEAVRYLTRVKPLRKAAFSDPSDRPTPDEQLETLAVQGRVSEPSPTRIVLVDDIVTRGATLLGAANRLAEVFPNAQISCFAAMRVVGPSDFVNVYDPQCGTIKFREQTRDTIRRP
jgi:phosphoribosylpyrophosphate synthetase